MKLIDRMKSSRENGLLVGGHRGHQCEIRENTLANFKTIDQSKIHYIEIDVQLTKDGEVVIFHDHDLSLKTDLKGMIRDYTLEELKASFELTTLEEAVSWCKNNDMGIAFELKIQTITMWEDRKAISKKLVEIIKKYDFFDMCFVFGKDYEMLTDIKKMETKICLGLIVPFVPQDPVKLMKDMDALIYLNFVEGLSKELVDKLHAAGYLVDASVVNSRESLKKALVLGADLIESDYPEMIIKFLEEEYES